MATKEEKKAHPLPAEGNEAKDLVVTESALPTLPSPEVLQEVFEKNFEGITPAFEVIKIPTGGGLAWTVPGEEEPEVQKELVGVILDHYPTRAYWQEEYSGGSSPPFCSSMDARKGLKERTEINGQPAFGECKTCQFSQFGTGKDGRGQACKFKHRVFILLKDKESIFPYLIPLPGTSAPEKGGYEGSLPTYFTKQAGKVRQYDQIVSKARLIGASARTYEVEKDGKKKTVGGEQFAKVQFFFVDLLSEQDRKTVAFLKEQLGPAMRQKPFQMEEYEETNGQRKADDAKGRDPWDT